MSASHNLAIRCDFSLSLSLLSQKYMPDTASVSEYFQHTGSLKPAYLKPPVPAVLIQPSWFMLSFEDSVVPQSNLLQFELSRVKQYISHGSLSKSHFL